MGRAKRLRVLVYKELRELSRERIVLVGLLLGPLIMYLILGGLVWATTNRAYQVIQRPTGVVFVVRGNVTMEVRELAEKLGAYLVRDNGLTHTPRGGVLVFVDGDRFTRALQVGGQPVLTLVVNATAPSFIEFIKAQTVVLAIERAMQDVLADKVRPCLPVGSGEFLRRPVVVEPLFTYRGKIYSQSAFMGVIIASSVVIPLSILIVVLAATQVAAVSLGIERESKTLEKLLSLPIGFSDVMASKIAAVTLLSAGGAVSNLIGFLAYAKILGASVERVPGFEGVEVGAKFEVSALDAILLFTGVMLALAITVLIGFIVGSAAKDVRSSQIAANYASIILAFPLFLLLFGLSPLILGPKARMALMLDPYVVLSLFTASILVGDSLWATTSLLALLGHLALWGVIASRILSPEGVLLGGSIIRRLIRGR
ncbi:MAG: ABC transporter permease subunit [Desulfurococcales archaeon]|nr:ABC transporter permease subunit [Desulfurococcales archaeon]